MNTSFRLATTGSVDGYLEVTNDGGNPCTLKSSYPTVEFMGRDGTGVSDVTYKQGSGGSGSVTLQPGETASSDVEWQASGDQCVARVWALNLSLQPGEKPKSVDPVLNDQPGQVFDLCGHEVTVSGWQKG
ncbi:DUF4232 domain-containing protein [Saccharopolyspora sp. NPDC002686]|uniref:DUF4232 domain-containing protein n=1 Tax=Saccharopolyspora sp. NPDC002686 TaxID=3154541 RepID=UPI00331FDC1A